MGNAQDDDTASDARGEGAAPERRARRRRATRTAAVAVLVAVVLGLAVLAWVGAPSAYPPYTPPPGAAPLNPEVAATDRAASTQAIVTTRASVLAALAGLGALVTIGINYRNSRTQLRNAEIAAQTLATTQETFRVTERGHQTGRYTAAIEQLGNTESIAIRLGGIYALEQLAQDSGRPSDQATVVEVLSAFIRLTASRTTTSSLGPVGSALPPPRSNRTLSGPVSDVAAALTVLGRLPRLKGVARADLTGADLTGASLVWADFRGACLVGADLTNADLSDADLSEADLTRADLIRAYLPFADLSRVILEHADLRGANLNQATFTDARLREANLGGANLGGADLRNVSLAGADLTGAYLNEALMSGAWLGGAKLDGAHFWDTSGVELSEVQRAIVASGPDFIPGVVPSPDEALEPVLEGEDSEAAP